MRTPENLTDSRSPTTLVIPPGFFSEATDRAAGPRYKDGNRVRFKNGLPQKIGGWIAQIIDGATFYGIDRREHEWVSLDGQNWIAQGTSRKLYLLNRGTRYDITPLRRQASLTNPFATTDTSAVVTVTDVAHGAQDGDFVRFSGATAVGGITLSGEYEIADVLNGNTYTITHSSPATSTTTGGGSVAAEYDINTGPASNTQARGFGTCTFGTGTWGTARGACSSLVNKLRLWSLDNFGEDLIASPRDGAIYWWDRSLGPTTRAVLLDQAPQTNKRVLMSQTGGQIVCLGAFDNVAGAPDPMLIRVGAEESLTDFVIAEDNTVFDKRLSVGSTIITGVRTRSGIVVFTDLAVYLMVPDATEIFNVIQLAAGNSAVGPNAAIEVNGSVYTMADKKFMVFDGVYTEIPCPIWGYVFDNEDDTPGFNDAQADKVYTWHNEKFSEIWWHYPSSGSTENDRCAIYNYAERIWYYMAIARTTGAPNGPSFTLPYAVAPDGTVYLHESGTDDDTSAMGEYIETNDFEVGDGKTGAMVSKLIPDMKRQLGTLLWTLKAKQRPQDATYVTKGPYSATPTTDEVDPRIAGRQIAVRLESTALGTDWRMGPPTVYLQPDAER